MYVAMPKKKTYHKGKFTNLYVVRIIIHLILFVK